MLIGSPVYGFTFKLFSKVGKCKPGRLFIMYDQVSEWVYSLGTKKPKFEMMFFINFVISLRSFEYWKVIFRIFLQNNKPFPVFQKYGSLSPRNPIINWEHLKYFCIVKMKMTIHFKESDFWVEILS